MQLGAEACADFAQGACLVHEVGGVGGRVGVEGGGVFGHKALYAGGVPFEAAEFEEGVEHQEAVFVLRLRELGFELGDGGPLPFVVHDGLVVVQRLGADGAVQHEAFERAAPAQGHVDLAGGEGVARVDHGLVEGEALALVDGDGPGQAQGVLGEGAQFLFLYLPGGGVGGVADVAPGVALHEDGLVVAGAADGDAVVVHLLDHAYLAVEVAAGGLGVVLEEHDLGPRLQFQRGFGGVAFLGVFALDLGPEARRGAYHA